MSVTVDRSRVEDLRVEYVLAPRYEEPGAWQRLYDALIPAPESQEASPS